MEQNNGPPRINIGLTRNDSNRSDASSVTLVDTPGTLVDTPTTLVETPRTPVGTQQIAFMEPPPVDRRRQRRNFTTVNTIPFPIPHNEQQLNLDWLDEEIENQPVRRRQRLNEPVVPRQGRMGEAFQIHDYSHGAAKPQIVELYSEVTGIPRTNYDPYTVKEYFKNKMIELINQSPRYTEEEKERKRNSFNNIYSSRLQGHETYIPLEAQLMGYSIDYASQQDPVFKQLYIDTYITDCAEAYSRGPALSCAPGTYERSYTSIAKAIEQRLREPNVDGHNLTDAKKEEYKTLFFLFEGVPDEFLFPVAREWLEKPDMPRGLEERKNSLRDYIIQRVREQFDYEVRPGDPSYRKINQKVINDPYVVSELEKETPEFGGRRTRRRKTRKIRKQRKTKGTRKTKKSRKTKTKKYLKRR
jgi:hypothetical protein